MLLHQQLAGIGHGRLMSHAALAAELCVGLPDVDQPLAELQLGGPLSCRRAEAPAAQSGSQAQQWRAVASCALRDW